MSIWYLSFCDETKPAGTQFLGVIQVRAADFARALEAIRTINPGGQIAAWELNDTGFIPDEWLGRLLSRSDLEKQAKLLTSNSTLSSTANIDIANSVSVFVCQTHNQGA